MNFKIPEQFFYEAGCLAPSHPKSNIQHPISHLRPYQHEAFTNRTHGLEVWLWGRQTGKSFTLAAWAIDRLITKPGRLVTILSNSRLNGMELNLKAAQICDRLRHCFEQEDLSADKRFETMNYETRITIHGQVGRIKVLPANPRTARGFSGDLILDEFAFHENSVAIWEAVEPILAAHPDYLCRVGSTPNGRHNMFYRLATNPNIPLRKVTRTDAWRQGCKIFHPITREEITPGLARALALDKRAYDQNYECVFENENMTLLTYDLITAAERPGLGIICEQDWSPELSHILPTLTNAYLGVDVGRNRDLTVITVLERKGQSLLVRAMLRLADVRLPDQFDRLAPLCGAPQFRAAHIDMTGLGVGLFEWAAKQWGARIRGINFATTVPISSHLRNEGRRGETVRVTEHLATQLLRAYEDRQIQHPIDEQLREDLRKPERLTSPSGQVSIAASRDDAGHADHFWSLALAVNAALDRPEPQMKVIKLSKRVRVPRKYLL